MAKRTARRSSTPKGPAKKAAAARKQTVSTSSGSRRKAGAKASPKKAAARKAAPKKKAAAKKPAGAGAKKVAAARRSAKPAKKAAQKAAKRAPVKKAVKPPTAPKAARKAGKVAAPARKVVPVAKAAPKKAAPRRRVTPRPDPVVQTPPSSLNMNRRGSAVRTGRAELAESRAEHANLTPSITGGDVDANVEDAYFTGDEAPGGDNPTPDQDIVDDIGKALGVEYQDNEELRGADKLEDRDKHRWELDPASAEDYRDRR